MENKPIQTSERPIRSLTQALVWTSLFGAVAYAAGIGAYVLLVIFISGSIALLFGLGSGEEATIAQSGTSTVIGSLESNMGVLIAGFFATLIFCLLSVTAARALFPKLARMSPILQGVLPIVGIYLLGSVGFAAYLLYI